MKRDNLPYDRLLAQERLIVAVTEALWEELERAGVRRADLADRLGVSKAYVTQALNGGQNLTLRTLADFAWALDAVVRVQLYPHALNESGYLLSESTARVRPERQYQLTEFEPPAPVESRAVRATYAA